MLRLVFLRKIRYFVFAFLPFAIFTAGYISSKILREDVKDFRSKCKRIIMFLDDALPAENNYEIAGKSSRELNVQLQDLCFILAHYKDHWSPY